MTQPANPVRRYNIDGEISDEGCFVSYHYHLLALQRVEERRSETIAMCEQLKLELQQYEKERDEFVLALWKERDEWRNCIQQARAEVIDDVIGLLKRMKDNGHVATD